MDLDPTTVANHWPFIRRHLDLERWPSADLALGALAVRQVECGGQSVTFGTWFWKAAGLTRGETGRITMTLLELERRGVVIRYRGRGSRPHAWSFAPSMRHWSMPWVGSGRNVHAVIRGCICRAARPGIARLPGRNDHPSRDWPTFYLSQADHVRPTGPLPVDTRDPRAERAMPGQSDAQMPVDTRDPRAAGGTPYLSSRELTFSIEGSEQRFAALIQGAEAKTGQELFGPRLRLRMAALAHRLTDDQVTALLKLLDRRVDRQFFPKTVEVLEDLSTTAEVKRAARFPGPGIAPWDGANKPAYFDDPA